ncbi:MAG: PorV/PorQ family protein [Saprospiraceae bacterium]
MRKILYTLVFLLVAVSAWAGNPDRQGEAGAAQLLMNPWAASAGLHTLNTSMASGVEAMRINPAGIVRINRTQVSIGYADYLSGTDLGLQALGFTSRIGKGSAIGLSIMSIDFGDIPVTVTDQPEGTGATLDLSYVNIGFSFAHEFENKVSVGLLLRGVTESTSDISAFGFALDAGVQYYTGENNEFKFGISLRNVGSRMKFGGQGLSTAADAPSGRYDITYNQRAAGFEMPSMLNIGASYDILVGEVNEGVADHRVTLIGNFTANSFSRDQLGGALEYSFRERFTLRGGYRSDISQDELTEVPLYDGLSAGAGVLVPLGKGKEKGTGLMINYGFRNTRIFNGTHNIGLTFSF